MKHRTSKRFKLVAVDLDGTLLDHRGQPHAKDVRALRAIAREGVAVSIVTGRLYSGTRASAKALGIVGPVGCADGSHVVDAATHATMLHHGLAGAHAQIVRGAIERNGAIAFLFAEDVIVHDSRGEEHLTYVRTWSEDVRAVAQVTDHALWESPVGITAVVAIGTAEQIHGTCDDINRDAGGHAQVAVFPLRRMPGSWGLVARAAGGTKGSALAYIAERHSCTLAETICVGDWMNDLSMFAVAGRSYAMGHAPDTVKRAATTVLTETSETGGGIARAVEDAFGLRF